MRNKITLKLALFPAMIACLITGCNMQPDYKRPSLPVGNQWNDKITIGNDAAEMNWSSFFTDSTIRQLISLSLKNNRDLKVAVLNIESARSQYGLSKANLAPTINAEVTKTATHMPGGLYNTKETGPVTYSEYEGNLAVSSWEVDFFGRLRSLKDQALENYLSYEATAQATQLTLVSEVAQAYITLCADADLENLAMTTAQSQQESLQLTIAKFNAGTVSSLDVLQAKTTVKSAEADVAKYERQRKQDANALELLLGTSLPAGIVKNATLQKKWIFPEISSGLPSSVLTRRPDIIAAEHTLKAANANIGAVRAAFFPSISLTASAGSASSSLGDLFSGGTGAWNFGPSISLPIFDGGKNRAQLDVAKTSQKIEVATYEKAIQEAFEEVTNALAGVETYGREVSSRKEDMDASDQYYQLAKLRYSSGADEYLDVLTAQRTLYSAQQEYISTLSSSLGQKVTLYKVLGGGWK